MWNGMDARVSLLTPHQKREFGLPHPAEEDAPCESKIWESLAENATREILSSYPKLRDPPIPQPKHKPKTNTPIPSLTPTCLHNLLTSLSDLPTTSLIFLSYLHLSNTFHITEAQVIWSIIYFLYLQPATQSLKRHTRNRIHGYIFPATVSGARRCG